MTPEPKRGRAGRSTADIIAEAQNMVGKKFGKLSVLAYEGNKNKCGIRMTTQCECGRVDSRLASEILRGRARACRSCSAAARFKEKGYIDPQPGEKFGKWTIVGPDISTSRKLFIVRCECGVEKKISGCNIVHNLGDECRDCYRKRTAGLDRLLWAKIVNGAKARNIELSITREQAEDLLEKQQYRCALSGVPIRLHVTAKEWRSGLLTASLDRIDSKKEYTLDNVQWVHKDLNYMKCDFTEPEFIQYCTDVYYTRVLLAKEPISYDDQGF